MIIGLTILVMYGEAGFKNAEAFAAMPDSIARPASENDSNAPLDAGFDARLFPIKAKALMRNNVSNMIVAIIKSHALLV